MITECGNDILKGNLGNNFQSANIAKTLPSTNFHQ